MLWILKKEASFHLNLKRYPVLKGLIASELLWTAQDLADKCYVVKMEAQGNLLANQLGMNVSHELLG